jgi:ATP-dependent DNA helicase RecQ
VKKLEAIKILKTIYGYEHFREGQKEVVESLLSGASTLAIFPTGAGKSMCYQLPALMMNGLTLVVSPLMALMKDQVDFLQSRGVKAAKLDSSLNQDEYKEVINDIRSNTLKILFVSPERFNNEIFRSLLDDIHISMFVIDEAHCISEWGHNFRPDYLKLAKYAKKFKADKVLCLTATANKAVEKDIVEKFSIQKNNRFRKSAYRENLNLNVINLKEEDKLSRLFEILSTKVIQPTIVYVTLQKTAKLVSDYLKEKGINSDYYHAGLDSNDRIRIQNEFMNSQDSVIVATVAFGMGIDKSNIRNVLHYNLPKSIENYYQEIGRAGRDGEISDCTLFLSDADIPTLETFAIGDFPEEDLVENLLIEILDKEEEFSLALTSFANSHDIKQIVVKTILTQLELKGHLEELTPIYSKASFKYLKSKDIIINMFPTQKRDFLIKFMNYVIEKKVWCYIDIDEVCTGLKIERKKALDVLEFLNHNNLIDLKMSILVNRYRFINKVNTHSNKEKLIEEICTTTKGHLDKQIQRIGELISFFTNNKCIHKSISNYFDTDIQKNCGHCTFCYNGESITMSKMSNVMIDFNINDFKSSLAGHDHILKSSSRTSKFLIGIRTPYASKNKLTKNKYFASLEGKAWANVFPFVEKNI